VPAAQRYSISLDFFFFSLTACLVHFFIFC
jgi:hypothetical protein